MDLRRLRTFVTVAEQGSVSKAALRLHISQPGLSRQIQELQQELGLRLFDRVGRRLVLTAGGEQLLGGCRGLLSQANSLSEQAQLLGRGATGVLKVAAGSGQIEAALSTFLPRYAERYPDVQVKVIETRGTDALGMLERGEAHIGIGVLEAGAADDRPIGIHIVPPYELLAVCHPSFPLEGGSMVDISRIVSHPLLLPDTGFVRRKTFDAVCQLAGLEPNILFESRASQTSLVLAEASLGVAIIASTTQIYRYTLRTVRITYKGKPIQYPRAVMWDKRRVLPPYAKDFCDSLAVHMRKLSPITQLPSSAAADVAKKRPRSQLKSNARS